MGVNSLLITLLLGDVELHHSTWKHPSRHPLHFSPRLHHAEKAVHEEEEDRAHGLPRVRPADVPCVEDEEYQVQLVHVVKDIEELLPHVGQRCECHDDPRHTGNYTCQIRYPCVAPFGQLPQHITTNY